MPERTLIYPLKRGASTKMIDKTHLGDAFSFEIRVPGILWIANETKNTETVTNVLLMAMGADTLTIIASRHQFYFKVRPDRGDRYILYKLVELVYEPTCETLWLPAAKTYEL